MCWSGEASTVLATIGIATTALAARKGEPPVLWITLGYFSLMELLQAYTYTVIDDCSNPGNQIATILGYLHITFQPFFINAISLYFIPTEVREKVAPWVYAVCFMSAIVMILQLYPFAWAGTCNPARPLCASQLCSVSGNWHIAWDIPVNGIADWLVNYPIVQGGFPTYALAAFILPFLYGSWRFTLYHYLVGPFLAHRLTDNINEWPAIWCLLSIGILIIVVKTPFRTFLHVNRWYLWPKVWSQYSEANTTPTKIHE